VAICRFRLCVGDRCTLRTETMFIRRLRSVDLHSLYNYAVCGHMSVFSVCVSGSPYGLKLCSNIG